MLNDRLCVAKLKTTFALDKGSQLLIYEWLTSLWFPDGYALNIVRLVNVEECILHGMKSYDCHIFMQVLIPIIYVDLFSKKIWDALPDISNFFWDNLFSKSSWQLCSFKPLFLYSHIYLIHRLSY